MSYLEKGFKKNLDQMEIIGGSEQLQATIEYVLPLLTPFKPYLEKGSKERITRVERELKALWKEVQRG